ncbi:type II toxin-antitoxin system RelE/ParE family toxin [Streptomyces californicus]|uniref:type II toxin-antitoxin system RelE/ParE family toxin n=1 Tax=Streptomyces californicus TaxID=67351 RepID=UPI00379F33D7
MTPRSSGGTDGDTSCGAPTQDMRILAALTALGDDPYREDAGIKKLAGPSGLYRLRVGGYRVAHQVEDGELVVLAVKAGDRRDVHRSL